MTMSIIRIEKGERSRERRRCSAEGVITGLNTALVTLRRLREPVRVEISKDRTLTRRMTPEADAILDAFEAELLGHKAAKVKELVDLQPDRRGL